MDLHRLRPADWLTGLAGLALLLLLWAPWYAVSDGTMNGWQAFALTDLWLALTALLAVAVVPVTAGRDAPAWPVAVDVLTAATSVIATLLVLLRLLDVPNDEVVTGREWGVVAAAVAVLATLVGSWWAMRDESGPGIKPHPVPELQPLPPPGAGPEPDADAT